MGWNQEISDYSIAVSAYEGKYNLPENLFMRPDYLAIKTADIHHFEEMVKSIMPTSEKLTCIEQDGRFLAAAKTIGEIGLGSFGKVNWIEILEPKPDRVGIDKPGLDHADFYYPEIDEVMTIFDRRDLDYELEAIGDHNRANVVFILGGRQFEFGIIDTPVAEIVDEDIASGNAYVLAA